MSEKPLKIVPALEAKTSPVAEAPAAGKSGLFARFGGKRLRLTLLVVLPAIACIALYVMKLSGPWRWIYAVTALLSLYFNIFVLVIQGFLKIPALSALAPGNPPSGPVFAVIQGIVLVFFILVIIGAIRRFRPV